MALSKFPSPPTPEEIDAAFPAGVFVSAEGPVALSGWSAGPEGIGRVTLSANDVRVETSDARDLREPLLLIGGLIHNRLAGRMLHFPLTLTVERQQVEIALDTGSHPFDVFTFEDRAVAVATVDGALVQVEAPTTALNGLRLRRCDARRLGIGAASPT